MKKKINILHLESSPGWGGQEIRTLKESLGMQKKGYRVFVAVEKNGGLYKEAVNAKIKAYEVRFKKIFWIFSFFKLIWIIKKNKIDLINTHSSLDSWLGGIIARLLGIVIIRTRHLSTKIKKGLNSRFLYGYLADYVVTTSKTAAEIVISQCNKDDKSCKSIPTGLDLDMIKYTQDEVNEFKNLYKLKAKDFLVGCACFMRAWKGIEDFLKAAKILENKKDIKFILIGGGHIETYIKMAEEMDLKNVIFTNHLKNPFPAIAALDLFVLLSTDHEGVSQASLQAAYLKKPMICTPTGGLKEVCIDNETGIQVPIFSADKVANGIIKIYEDENLKNRFSENAYSLSLNFSFDRMLDDMESLYFGLFEKKHFLNN